jgi:hypothetical protein
MLLEEVQEFSGRLLGGNANGFRGAYRKGQYDSENCKLNSVNHKQTIPVPINMAPKTTPTLLTGLFDIGNGMNVS